MKAWRAGRKGLPNTRFPRRTKAVRIFPSMHPCLLLLATVALTVGCFADEDDIEQSWPSPNGRFTLHHTANYNHHLIDRRKKEDIYDQPAAYTLTRKGRVLWSAESPVDESA